jgi:uncharacterized protein YfeS
MELKTNKENIYIKLEVFYHKGGYNCATCEQQARGYYLLIVPEERRIQDGYTILIASAFSGCKILLEKSKRLSKKRLVELTTNIDINKYKYIIDKIAEQNNLFLL